MMSLIKKIQLLEKIATKDCKCETKGYDKCRSCHAGEMLNNLNEIASYNFEEVLKMRVMNYETVS
jgi:hypothetical protein